MDSLARAPSPSQYPVPPSNSYQDQQQAASQRTRSPSYNYAQLTQQSSLIDLPPGSSSSSSSRPPFAIGEPASRSRYLSSSPSPSKSQQAQQSHQYLSHGQQQVPLDEAFNYQAQPPFANGTQQGHSATNLNLRSTSVPQPSTSSSQDVKSLYHLPSEPFDSSFSLAGLKSSPIAEYVASSDKKRFFTPGTSAQNFSAATAAFAQSLGTIQGRQSPLAMPLHHGARGSDGTLDPTSMSFSPTVQTRKGSYAIPIVQPGQKGDEEQKDVSPVNSRNSSLSSEGSGMSKDGKTGDGEDKVAFRSPTKRQPHPTSITAANGPAPFSGNAPGTPPRSATYGVPSIQTIAATPMKAKYSPTSLVHAHRRNDSFVGPDESEEAGQSHGSPRRGSRLSLGGSNPSLRQGSIASLGKRNSVASIMSSAGGNGEEKHDKRTLWFGDLEPWMDDNYMRSVTGMCGWDVDNIKLIRPTMAGGVPETSPIMNAGYCFITFATQEEALRVLTIITPSATNAPVPMPNASRNFRANWASGATVANPFTNATSLPPTDGKEYSVFVGDLAPSVTEEILIQTFMNPPEMMDAVKIEGFAGVRGAKIMTDPVTGLSKMYGFVRLSNEEEQQRALVEMQGVPCLARPMRISPATTRARTASGAVEPMPTNIARAVTPDYLLPGRSGSQATAPAASIAAPPPRAPSPIPTTIHRPIPTLASSLVNSFAQPYSSGSLNGPSPGEIAIAADPSLALSLMQIKMIAATPAVPNPNGPNVHHTVTFNDPNNTTVFVGGLSSTVTEDMLRAFFAPFGEISKVTVPPGKKCGFVHFITKADAEISIDKMQGFPLAGGQLRLSWGKSSAGTTKSSGQQTQPVVQQLVTPAPALNPLQAQILQMQQQLAALTALAGGQAVAPAVPGYGTMLPMVPGLPASTSMSYPSGNPASSAGDALSTLARTDPHLFAQLVAANPGVLNGALGGMAIQTPAAVPAYDGSIAAQLQANQQQMLQLQAMQAQLEEPSLSGFSPFAANAAAGMASRQQEPMQFWTAKNPPVPGRSVSPFSQAAQAMAERASERNSGRSRHSTSPGEQTAFLSAPSAGQANNSSRRGSGSARYISPNQVFNGDFAGQSRSRTQSESVFQAFGGLSVSGQPQQRWEGSNGAVGGANGQFASYPDPSRRGFTEEPRVSNRGGSFAGA